MTFLSFHFFVFFLYLFEAVKLNTIFYDFYQPIIKWLKLSLFRLRISKSVNQPHEQCASQASPPIDSLYLCRVEGRMEKFVLMKDSVRCSIRWDNTFQVLAVITTRLTAGQSVLNIYCSEGESLIICIAGQKYH